MLLFVIPDICAQGAAGALTGRFEKNQGIVVQQDSLFMMTVRFRMQNRFAYTSVSGDDLDIGATDMRIRRMRLRFEGFVLSPKVRYKVQLGFSKADMDLIENSTAQPVRDAIGYYVPNKHWSFGLGQAKLPGNRQRTVSSGAQQLPDRSIANAAFTLDRDFGLFTTWQSAGSGQLLVLKGAITTGEGRNMGQGTSGLCYTGRAEWLPFGAFTSHGDDFEGDLEREGRPKVAMGVVYSMNIDARRSRGQLGEFYPGGEGRTHNTFIADALFKYHGTSLSSELLMREFQGDPTVLVDGIAAAGLEGWGMNWQVGRMLGERCEVVGRYAIVVPTDRVDHTYQRREDAWVGFNQYFNHHRVKLQGAVNYTWMDGVGDLEGDGNQWGFWVQMELGI